VKRLALVARLKPESEPRAKELIAQGPPFDLGEGGFVRHSVFLSSTEVIFVFEAPEVEWLVDSLVDEPFHWKLRDALDEWRPLVEGRPRVAREQFFWERDGPTEDVSG
jgi:hypothetical protein